MADWSRLPNDLLVLIANCLKTGSDVSGFRSVCTSWRSSVCRFRPRRLKIPNFDLQFADHFYLLERTIYVVGPPESFVQSYYHPPQFWFVKVEEDEHGIKHLLHPLTSSKIKTSFFQNVLDSSKFEVYEWGKEYVLQYNPKDQASREYDYERKLAFRKVAFKGLSRDTYSGDFELLLEHFLGGLVLFNSADMQWTRLDFPLYLTYSLITISGRFLNFSYRQCKIFLINLEVRWLIRVEIWYNIHGDFSTSVGKFDCLKPNGELIIFNIYITNIDDQPK